ncbi:hypothetical protein [Candidatus Uabimicrobium sp. HlEnr_7]|uniref:hypothetical protein n=1 Tax=Candidatus Uabimicrobium helgolandensis TaxID=3095367 RepID=UPI003556211F
MNIQIGYPYAASNFETTKDSVVILQPTKYCGFHSVVVNGVEHKLSVTDAGPKILNRVVDRGVVGTLIESPDERRSIAQHGQIIGQGTSMQLAIALSVFTKKICDGPIILFSGAIELPTGAPPFVDAQIRTYCSSKIAEQGLVAKYRAAKMAKAHALVLPQRDAKIISSALNIEYQPLKYLSVAIKENRLSPAIIGVKSNELPTMANLLGISSFYYKKKSKKLSIVATILIVVLLAFWLGLNQVYAAKIDQKQREKFADKISTMLISFEDDAKWRQQIKQLANTFIVDEKIIGELLLSSDSRKQWIAIHLIHEKNIQSTYIIQILQKYLFTQRPFHDLALKILADSESPEFLQLLNKQNKLAGYIAIKASQYLLSYTKNFTLAEKQMLIEQLLSSKVDSNIKRNICKRLLKSSFRGVPKNIAQLIEVTDHDQLEEMFELITHVAHDVGTHIQEYLRKTTQPQALENWLRILEIVDASSSCDLSLLTRLYSSNPQLLSYFLNKYKGQVFLKAVDILNQKNSRAHVLIQSLALSDLDWINASEIFVNSVHNLIIEDNYHSRKKFAVCVLSKIAQYNDRALHFLINCLDNKNLGKYTTELLGAGNFDLSKVKKQLLEVTQRRNYDSNILKVISKLGTQAKSIVPALIKKLIVSPGKNDAIRFCILAIGDVEQIASSLKKSQNAIEKRILIELLLSFESDKTQNFVELVRKFTFSFNKKLKTVAWIFLAKHNSSLIPQIHEKYLESRLNSIKRYIAIGLSYLPCHENIQFFIKILKQSNRSKNQALLAFGKWGTYSTTALPDIIKLYPSNDYSLNRQIVTTISQVSSDAKYLNLLLKKLKPNHQHFRSQIFEAIMFKDKAAVLQSKELQQIFTDYFRRDRHKIMSMLNKKDRKFTPLILSCMKMHYPHQMIKSISFMRQMKIENVLLEELQKTESSKLHILYILQNTLWKLTQEDKKVLQQISIKNDSWLVRAHARKLFLK